MATVTPNLGLTLPIGSEKVSRSIINGNMSIIDTFCGDINKSTLRDVPFAIAVNDWTSVNGQWVAEFTTAYVTASSKEIGYYDNSIVSYAKAHILMEKKSGGGGMVFTTAKKPSGLIQGNILVFDNDDLKIPVLIEDTVVPIANGGTGQSTLAGAKQALGITALADQIAGISIPKVFCVDAQGSSTSNYAECTLPQNARFTANFPLFVISVYRSNGESAGDGYGLLKIDSGNAYLIRKTGMTNVTGVSYDSSTRKLHFDCGTYESFLIFGLTT